MADFISSTEIPPIVSSASSSGAADDEFEDSCSICLDPFNSDDPPTVTSCRHEYHLHCILEWSQRSKECPICWQHFLLKDPASQELLEAVKSESILRVKQNAGHIHEVYEINDLIMLRLATASSRAHFVRRRGRQRHFGFDSSQVTFAPSLDIPAGEQRNTSSADEFHSFDNEVLESYTPTTPTSRTTHTINVENHFSVDPYVVNAVPNAGNTARHTKLRGFFGQSPPDSPQKPSSSEFLTFSGSIKTRFTAASARYKESLSKSTQGFKEKLLARNVSVKELGKGVQREMSAGIAGVARMIDRIDISSKRRGTSFPLSTTTARALDLSYKGKGVQGNVKTPALNGNCGETANDMSSAELPRMDDAIPIRLEVSLSENAK